MAHKWTQITDLPSDWQPLASAQLRSFAMIWKEQHERLQKLDSMRAFNDRLSREWSIETGVIENIYHIDKGVTVVLVEKGIEASLIPHGASDRPAEEVVRIVRDHQEALEGLFAFIKQDRQLSKSYICELHAQMLKHQKTTIGENSLGDLVEIELKRGRFKLLPNNPSIPGIGLHQYCPPEHVESEMDNLVSWHRNHLSAGVSAEVEAAWLHHRITQIHPFQDGNGRVARALASLVFIRDGFFPLLITRDTRAGYIEALGLADNGDLLPWITFFAKQQKSSLLKALSLSEDVIRRSQSLHDVIGAAVDRLRQRKGDVAEAQQWVFDLAASLESVAEDHFRSIASTLDSQLKQLDSHYSASVDRNEAHNDFWFKGQIVHTAKQHGYFADTMTYKAWVRLRVFDERQASLVFSFHSVGTQFVGVLAVSAFVEIREKNTGGNDLVIDGPYTISDDLFEFSYHDVEQDVRERFEKWLDETVATGLEQWRRQL
jgi:Fic family protein